MVTPGVIGSCPSSSRLRSQRSTRVTWLCTVAARWPGRVPGRWRWRSSRSPPSLPVRTHPAWHDRTQRAPGEEEIGLWRDDLLLESPRLVQRPRPLPGTTPTPAIEWREKTSVGGGPTSVPYPGAWDGPLWTLFYEVLCYAAVGLLVTVVGRHRLKAFLFGGWLLLTALSMADTLGGVRGPSFTPFFIELAPYFFAGALLYTLRERVPLHWSLAACSAAVVGIVPALGAPAVLVALPLGHL